MRIRPALEIGVVLLHASSGPLRKTISDLLSHRAGMYITDAGCSQESCRFKSLSDLVKSSARINFFVQDNSLLTCLQHQITASTWAKKLCSGGFTLANKKGLSRKCIEFLSRFVWNKCNNLGANGSFSIGKQWSPVKSLVPLSADMIRDLIFFSLPESTGVG